MEKDIVYYDGEPFDLQRHQLDIYIPQGVEDYPVLLFVHGGAWVSGTKGGVASVGKALASYGIGVVAVNYRLSPVVTHPAHIEDIAQAFAWTVDNLADYGGDPERIVVGGHSAGGHLTSLLTLDPQYLESVGHSPDEILGVLNVSGVFWIDDWIMQWARGAFPDDQKGRDAASPINFVHEDAPPFMLMISQNDYPELIVETDAMYDALIEAKIPVTKSMIPDRDHYSIIDYVGTKNDDTAQQMFDWLQTIFEPQDSQP